jgi:hypothetical protein
MYNTNEFRTETMYDYYKAMKSMFLGYKFFFSHPLLSMQDLLFSFHELNINNTETNQKSKAVQNQNFNFNNFVFKS